MSVSRMFSVSRRVASLGGGAKRFFAGAVDLKRHGLKISPNASVYHNLDYDSIFAHEVAAGEVVTKNGTVTVDTGKFTGRSPKDKYIVKQSPSDKNVGWGSVNAPMSLELFNKLHNKVLDHYSSAEKVYVFDGYCGASPGSRIKVRFVTEIAWQHHFVTNMFIRPTSAEEIENFVPDFTIINACKVTNPDWKADGLNSEVFVGFNLEEKTAIIGGTWYGGEMKKGIFSVMNYLLPLNDIMSMHCSANIGMEDNNTALFFGLSGTGKTTLSADPHRFLIGDDEHGWDDKGIFNLEGGCYAKTIDLAEETEPDIYRAIRRDALLENVAVDPVSKEVDFFDVSKTQNARVSYPIYHIPNFKDDSMGGHPNNIIFLTADAFGVLPPVSRLSTGQAMYHFLSGYTAKVAGTELGVTEPKATFSACFGEAFMMLHPTKYADLLARKLEKHNTKVFLVNTGWSGGSYGVGKRMKLSITRQCIDAIHSGDINKSNFRLDDNFGFEVPTSLTGVDATILNPRETWQDKEQYDATALKLSGMFKKNYSRYKGANVTDYSPFGPKIGSA
jgi:phosphoenolpyruvate carboxykinase (ATP)